MIRNAVHASSAQSVGRVLWMCAQPGVMEGYEDARQLLPLSHEGRVPEWQHYYEQGRILVAELRRAGVVVEPWRARDETPQPAIAFLLEQLRRRRQIAAGQP